MTVDGLIGHLLIIASNSSNNDIHPGAPCISNHHVNDGTAMVNLASLSGARVQLNYLTAICTASVQLKIL